MPRTPPTCGCGVCRTCRHREAQRRYRATDKGKATHLRYRRSDKGKPVVARINAKRIFAGSRHRGYAPTVAIAQRIKQHIKERIRAFREKMSERSQC